MRTSAFGALLIATLITLGAGCASTPPAPEPAGSTYPEGQAPTETPDLPTSAAPSGIETAQAAENGDAKAFTVVGDNFDFSLKEMRVKKGDRVRVTFKNAEGFHDFRLDEFNVATAKQQAGGEETVEFIADKAGTFEYYCSVGKHRQMGMKGNLIVE
ncbi:MAG TPA: plastocyanin/azurin family copper-binding protein [Candidatus Baltobacteraceae bacterium]|nr:plastocyanin/azurin family copper-binding protein [Candidatus Baltobacteraceae bacterium]